MLLMFQEEVQLDSDNISNTIPQQKLSHHGKLGTFIVEGTGQATK